MRHSDEDEDDEPVERKGGADDSSEVVCPYCGEVVEITLDPGGNSVQEYVEDCQVCCRPWKVRVVYDEDGDATVSVEAEDDNDADIDPDIDDDA